MKTIYSKILNNGAVVAWAVLMTVMMIGGTSMTVRYVQATEAVAEHCDPNATWDTPLTDSCTRAQAELSEAQNFWRHLTEFAAAATFALAFARVSFHYTRNYFIKAAKTDTTSATLAAACIIAYAIGFAALVYLWGVTA